MTVYIVHKSVGYMLKCKENLALLFWNYYRMVQTHKNNSENIFLNKNAKLKDIFTKWPVFPPKLCALHRTAGQNVGNASLAKRGRFFYTFYKGE
ncbi:hypothetical protein HMPREF9436_02520 [Faecalibacterium cf. prausnitzii KLE1255]|uniref:Uncharacterized protein n=1 Tax=Faecalibacterium cf. prausnitzii KLE1255 TaxID=748224 RepID=E2ZLG3_9FIRM|nr:hypothetical protein HMPREF9436_02520 [Faecalibacterium cf. prausnitzii KLE1255]